MQRLNDLESRFEHLAKSQSNLHNAPFSKSDITPDYVGRAELNQLLEGIRWSAEQEVQKRRLVNGVVDQLKEELTSEVKQRAGDISRLSSELNEVNNTFKSSTAGIGKRQNGSDSET